MTDHSFVPDLARFDHDQRVQARAVPEDAAVIEVSRHDRVRQRVDTQMITFDGQGMHLRPGRTLRRLGPAPVHRRQRQPRLGLPASLTSQPNAVR